VPPRRYRDAYLRAETYAKLLQLKVALGKRSVGDVVEELLKGFTVSTVTPPVNTVKPPVLTGDSPVSTVKLTESTVSPNVSTGGPPVSTVNQDGGCGDGELVRRVESLERGLAELRGALDVLARELRGLRDSVNAYTGKTDQVLQRLSQVVETLEHVAEALGQQGPATGGKASGSEEASGRGRRSGRDACEVLEREGVVYESDIAGKIKNRDAFFAKLRRACGAVVLETAKERVAVRPALWEEFRNRLTSLTTSDEGRISKELGEGGFRLFKVLREGGIVYYDSTGKRWVVVG
jgi:uncharacterized protein YukE